jgi:hypothetical protein
LPAGWDVYTGANRKPTKPAKPARWRGSGWWKYGVWFLLLAPLAVIAFYPWHL